MRRALLVTAVLLISPAGFIAATIEPEAPPVPAQAATHAPSPVPAPSPAPAASPDAAPSPVPAGSPAAAPSPAPATSPAVAPSPAPAPPPPAGCHWQPIPEIKASLAVPDGWQFAKVSSGQLLAYEVRPAGPGFEKTRSVFRLEARLTTPVADVVARARDFVENVGKQAAESLVSEQRVGVMTGFSTFVQLPAEPGSAPPATVAAVSIANTRTGTLYTVRFEIPADELDRVGPLGNALFQEYQLDDEV